MLIVKSIFLAKSLSPTVACQPPYHWIISDSTCHHTCGNILSIASQEEDNIAAGHTKNEELSLPVASSSGFVNDIILAYCLFIGLLLASYMFQPRTYYFLCSSTAQCWR